MCFLTRRVAFGSVLCNSYDRSLSVCGSSALWIVMSELVSHDYACCVYQLRCDLHGSKMMCDAQISLVREPKVQSLVALVSRRREVMLPLLLGHGLPLRLATAVDGHVQNLGANKQADVPAANSYEHFVAGSVQWLVFCTVDLEQACQ